MRNNLTDSRIFYCLLTLLVVYSLAIGFSPNTQLAWPDVITEYGHFFLVGLLAAIVANTTGAGGGIIFFPAFVLLGMTAEVALATSFAIQCFGMTAGALAWRKIRLNVTSIQESKQWSDFYKILKITLPSSVLGLWITQYGFPVPPLSVHTLFSVFSIMVGGILFARSLGTQLAETNGSVKSITLCWVSFVGGIITAWLSVGIGELLAVLLILRGYTVNFSIAIAVTVSAINVWAGLPYHLWLTENVHTQVWMFAAPAAALGGALAGIIAMKVGAQTLKRFVATWIVFSGVCYLVVTALS